MARDLKLEVVLAAIDKATKPIRAITEGSVGLARQLKTTRDTLKGLQGQQKDISSFKALKGASDQTRQAMQSSTDRVKALSQELANTSNPTKALNNEFKRAVRESQQLKNRHGEQQRELQGLRGRLNEAGISTKNLGQHERDLRQKLASTNQTLNQQESRLKRVTEQQNRLAKAKASYEKSQRLASNMATTGAAGLAAGSGVLYAGARMMAPGLEYGAQMSELQAVARLGKDDPRMQMLKEQARGLGASTAFSATEVGAGQTFLARAGFTPEAINSSMQDILDLALANGADLARTADIASNISSAFKIDPEVEGNITRVADVLSGTAARSNVNLESLGDTMKYLGGAEDLGLSLEQAATMAGLMGNIGIQGSQAGTAMRAMMNRLTGPAAKGRKAMESLGLQVEDATGKMRSMPDILRDLNSATKDMGNVQRKSLLTDIFGAEAGSGMAELVGQMSGGGLDDLLDQLHNVAGENARMAATRSDNIAGDIKGLQSAWEEIGIGLSDTNEGPLRELITSLTGVVRSVGEWMKANPKLVATIAKVVAIVAALVAAGGAIAVMLASVIGPIAMIRYGLTLLGVQGAAIIPVIKAVGATVLGLGKALLTTPLGIFVAAAAVAAFLLIKHWDKVKAFFAGFVRGLVDGFKGMTHALAQSFKPVVSMLKAIGSALAPVIGWFKALLAPVDSTSEALQRAESAGEKFGRVIGALGVLAGVAVAIKAVGVAMAVAGKLMMINPIVLIIMAIIAAGYLLWRNWDKISGWIKETWGGLANSVRSIWEPVIDFFKGIWATIRTAFDGGLRGIAALIINWSPLGLFYKAFAGVLGWFGVELPGKFTEFGGNLISALVNGIKAMFGGLLDLFTGAWAEIKTAFDGGLLGVSQLIINWSPLGLFYQAFAGVLSWFGVELPGKFTEFGGMLMSGMVSGITAGLGKVKDAITGAGDRAVGWFKDKLGIRSPSRVFAALGDDTMHGLQAGLDRSQNGPLASLTKTTKALASAGALALGVTAAPAMADQALPEQHIRQQVSQVLAPAVTPELPELVQRIRVIVDMPAGLADIATREDVSIDSRPPLTMANAPVTVEGDTITIQITAAPGSNPAELEQMINRVLNERERNKAARIRSSLYDND